MNITRFKTSNKQN